MSLCGIVMCYYIRITPNPLTNTPWMILKQVPISVTLQGAGLDLVTYSKL